MTNADEQWTNIMKNMIDKLCSINKYDQGLINAIIFNFIYIHDNEQIYINKNLKKRCEIIFWIHDESYEDNKNKLIKLFKYIDNRELYKIYIMHKIKKYTLNCYNNNNYLFFIDEISKIKYIIE